MALVDSTMSATPMLQSSGSGEYSAGSIRRPKTRKTAMLPQNAWVPPGVGMGAGSLGIGTVDQIRPSLEMGSPDPLNTKSSPEQSSFRAGCRIVVYQPDCLPIA